MNVQHLTDLARAGYEFLIASASISKIALPASYPALLGWQMFVAGSAHLSDVPAMVERFQEWGVPFPIFNVYVSGLTECVWSSVARRLCVPVDHHTADH